MWKKVLYFSMAVIIGIIVAIFTYISNQYNHIYNLTGNAIKEQRYADVVKVFGGCFDTNPAASDDEDDIQLFVYNGTSLTDVAYGEEKNERFLSYEQAYYIYVFEANFSYLTISGSDGYYNKTALVLNGESGSYTYNYVVDQQINKDYYIEKPKSAAECQLNNTRNLVDSMNNWDFVMVNFTKSMLDEITKTTGKITEIQALNNEGEVICTVDVNLDFSQDFFKNETMVELFTTQNYYLGLEASGKLTEEDRASYQEFNIAWETKFNEEKEQTGYTLRFSDSEISPSSIIWQTVGMVVFYIVIIIILYILLFHFAFVKNIFSKDTYKDYRKKKRETLVVPEYKKEEK